ncbi:MAG: F0F1 ATP synthase subunit gamma [Chloroflexota bacterium]|nr:F0F1 ATP synthase subunit gamma [Chloroflexota bacterium]
MPSTREIRRRIKSVKNISQITRAMEMVAASRMRRAQQAVLAGRPYAEKLDEVIANLSARLGAMDVDVSHPLLQRRAVVKNTGVVLITSDKGLCGSMNSNVIRRTTRFVLDEAPAGGAFEVVPVGRKGRDFMVRYGRPVVAEFTNYSDRPSPDYIIPIARVITEEYAAGRIDAVYLIYSEFVNTLVQKPVVIPLLPLQPSEVSGPQLEYIYEPSPEAVLTQLVPRYIEARIYQALLESIASEQSARLVAMRNATKAAKDMVADLSLSYNKLRQANITKELTEIAGGAAALTG